MGTVRKASNKKLGKRIQNILFRKQYLHKRRIEKVYIYNKILRKENQPPMVSNNTYQKFIEDIQSKVQFNILDNNG